MKTVTAKLQRFAPMYGWRNRILRVDLSDGRIWAQESAPDVPAFLGARGLAAKILWDEYPDPVGEFDPRNPLMIMPGALTGTRSPYSGRTNVCAFSPQCAPYPWFSRASIGAEFGAELKKAGYDGIVVTGASDTPVQILIRDDEVSNPGCRRVVGPRYHRDAGGSPSRSRGQGQDAGHRAGGASACLASPPSRRPPLLWQGRGALARVMGPKSSRPSR
jgi:aldehyde:ferredoxin oxidoreductase